MEGRTHPHPRPLRQSNTARAESSTALSAGGHGSHHPASRKTCPLHGCCPWEAVPGHLRKCTVLRAAQTAKTLSTCCGHSGSGDILHLFPELRLRTQYVSCRLERSFPRKKAVDAKQETWHETAWMPPIAAPGQHWATVSCTIAAAASAVPTPEHDVDNRVRLRPMKVTLITSARRLEHKTNQLASLAHTATFGCCSGTLFKTRPGTRDLIVAQAMRTALAARVSRVSVPLTSASRLA